jgi:membrane-associated phospholipid phosphatase
MQVLFPSRRFSFPNKKLVRSLFTAVLLCSYGYGHTQFAASSSPQKTAEDTLTDKMSGYKAVPGDSIAPPVYRMNYWISGGFSALATVGNIYAIPNILHAKPQLTPEELAGLNRNVPNGLDRWALRLDPTQREAFYKASDIFLPALMLAGGAVTLDKRVRKDWLKMLVMHYEVQAVAFSLYNFSFFGPAFQNKIRPVSYYDYFPEGLRRGGNQRNSFFSGHVAQSTAATFFFVKVYTDYHPEIGKRRFLYYGLASIPPLVQGYLRMRALAHFPSDILAGYAIGAVCGIAIPALHRYRIKNVQGGVTWTPTGPGLGITWKPKSKTPRSLDTFTPVALSR